MKIFKNLFGKGDKIHVNEIAVTPKLLLGDAVIIESGRIGSIEYDIFGNGTQICWGTKAATSNAGNGTIIFEFIPPKPFINNKCYANFIVLSSSYLEVGGVVNITSSGNIHFRTRMPEMGVEYTAFIFAIGRWK